MSDYIVQLIVIALGSSLVSNVVLSQFLGLCPFLGVSKSVKTAAGMGGAVIFVITLASLVAGLLYEFVLEPLGITFLKTIVFILVIAALVQFVELFLKKYMKSLYKALGVFLPLITTNCAVLGVTVNNINDGLNFVDSMLTSLGCGIGFFLAMILFCGVCGRVAEAKPAKSFEGLAITLISAAIVSLSFFGFAGVIGNLYG